MKDGFTNPVTKIFYNNFGITNSEELETKIGNVSLGQLAMLVDGIQSLPGKFDAQHLKQIHNRLFGEVFPWAGQTRAWGQFQGEKKTPANGFSEYMRFSPYAQLDSRLNIIGDQLQKENFLQGLDKKQFSNRLGYYFDQYNYTHAFREGNGRTLQVVAAEIGRAAGYDVKLTADQSMRLNYARDTALVRVAGPGGASAQQQNLKLITDLLHDATQPAPGAAAEALRQPALARPLAELTPGMQQLEALRMLSLSGREIASSMVDIDKGNQQRGQQVLDKVLEITHCPDRWKQNADVITRAAKEIIVHPILKTEPGTVMYAMAVLDAGRQLDKHLVLSMPFREKEIPREEFARYGKPVDELWKEGQMEKILMGQRSDKLAFVIPATASSVEQQVPLQFRLANEEDGKVAVKVYIPAAAIKIIQQAASHSAESKAIPPLRSIPPLPSERPGARSEQKNEREKEQAKQKPPTPKRRGPKL